MNLRMILKRVARLESTPLLDDRNFPIARNSGMAGLRAAIARATEASQNAPPSLPLGDMPNGPLTPVARLRADILADQKRRAAMGPPVDCPAIYPDDPDDNEGADQCTAAPPLPAPTTPEISNE